MLRRYTRQLSVSLIVSLGSLTHASICLSVSGCVDQCAIFDQQCLGDSHVRQCDGRLACCVRDQWHEWPAVCDQLHRDWYDTIHQCQDTEATPTTPPPPPSPSPCVRARQVLTSLASTADVIPPVVYEPFWDTENIVLAVLFGIGVLIMVVGLGVAIYWYNVRFSKREDYESL